MSDNEQTNEETTEVVEAVADVGEKTETLDAKMDEATRKATSPEEVAAQLFYLYHPKFTMLIDALPKKALTRVLKKLVTYPLVDKTYKGQSEIEKNAYLIGDRLLEAKYVMTIFAMGEQMAKKIEKEEAEEAKIEKITEENKENSNG